MPGHGHRVWPHRRADELLRMAQEVQRAYLEEYDNIWGSYMESSTMHWLRRKLLFASLRSAAMSPSLKTQLRHPNPRRFFTKRSTSLRAYLDGVLPTLGRPQMPGQWSDSWIAVLTRPNGSVNIKSEVPFHVSDPYRVFINGGINTFAVVLDDPAPLQSVMDLVRYEGNR